MTWTVEFYEEEDGSAPVEKFLAQLAKEHRAKALAIVKLLEEMGPTLPFPYSSQVKGTIRELRTQQGKDKIRILYFADKERRFILLHAFIKRTGKLSGNAIAIAERRMKKHEQKTENPAGQKLKARGAKRHQLKNLWFEITREEKDRKWIRIGGRFGEAEMECWPVEEGLMMKGRIDCGTVELTVYPDPEGGGTTPQKHKCDWAEEDCVLGEFLQELEINRRFVM